MIIELELPSGAKMRVESQEHESVSYELKSLIGAVRDRVQDGKVEGL